MLNNGRVLDSNRGVELMLRKKKHEDLLYLLCFEKTFFFLKKKLNIYFKFSLDIGNSK